MQPDIYKISRSKQNKYLKSQIESVKIIKNIITENNIECDLKEVDSILFTQNNNNVQKINDIEKLLKENNIKIKKVKNSKIIYGIRVSDTYTFNPLKYLFALKKIIEPNINIYENVLCKQIKYKDKIYYAQTNFGVLKAKNIIIACHYPFFIFPLLFPIKTYIKREYVNAIV